MSICLDWPAKEKLTAKTSLQMGEPALYVCAQRAWVLIILTIMNCRLKDTNESLEDLVGDHEYLTRVTKQAASLIGLDPTYTSITALEVIDLMNTIQ